MVKNKRPIGRQPGYSPGLTRKIDTIYGEWSWNSQNLWSKVDKSSAGCWEWRGARGPYGALFGAWKNGHQQMTQTRRLIYAEAHDKDVTELSIYHSCNNNMCCNPDHMFEGPNQRLGIKKYR